MLPIEIIACLSLSDCITSTTCHSIFPFLSFVSLLDNLNCKIVENDFGYTCPIIEKHDPNKPF